MKAYSYAILDAANELGVGVCRGRGQMAPSSFAVNGEKASEGKLKPRSITPGADGVCKCHGLRAALEAESGERVRHEALAKSGVDRAEHQIGVCRPNEIRWSLIYAGRLGRERGDSQATAATDSDIGRSHAEGETTDRSGDRGGIV
jgi:hypothetical protein